MADTKESLLSHNVVSDTMDVEAEQESNFNSAISTQEEAHDEHGMESLFKEDTDDQKREQDSGFHGEDVETAPIPQDTEAALSQTKSVGEEENSEVGDMSLTDPSSLNQSNLSQMTESSQKTGPSKIQADEAAYRSYRVRKTTSLVNRCINSGVKLESQYVKLARTLLSTPDDLAVDQIETLNLKCQSALQSEHSSDSGSDSEEQDVAKSSKTQVILPPKAKRIKTKSSSSDSRSQREVSSYNFGAGVVPNQQPLFYQGPPQTQNFGFAYGQTASYAPSFGSFQYPPPTTYSHPPQFRFGTQSFAYNRKPENYQVPFRFGNPAFQQKLSNSPVSPPLPNQTSTPKPTSTETQAQDLVQGVNTSFNPDDNNADDLQLDGIADTDGQTNASSTGDLARKDVDNNDSGNVSDTNLQTASPDTNQPGKDAPESVWSAYIKSFPLGERRLPMEYLQRMDKPEHYSWDEWYDFSNKEFLQSQMALKQQEEEAAILKKKQRENEQRHAQQLLRDMTKNLLPSGFSVPIPSKGQNEGQKQVLPKPVSPVKIKTEPGITNSKQNSNVCSTEKPSQSANGSGSGKAQSDILSKEKESEQKILELATTVKGFVTELSDMFHDDRVVAAIDHLKKIGDDLRNDQHICHSDSTSSQKTGKQTQHTGLLQPRNLDFSPQRLQNMKQDPDSPIVARPRQMFPGMKRQSFDSFQDSTKKRKITNQSPARATGNLSSKIGSPKIGGAQRTQSVDYISLTDAKVAVIVQGNEVLKKRKSTKICQPIWNEAEKMNRVILEAPDGNFYYLLSGFKPSYSSVPETLRASKFKEDFFDFIVENISYTKLWAGAILTGKNKNFLDYCSNCVKEGPTGNVDAFQIVMMSQYLGHNISLLYGQGDRWSADPDVMDDIVFVYRGDNEFTPTDVVQRLKEDYNTYPWTGTFPPAYTNGSDQRSKSSKHDSDSDSKTETISLDSDSIDSTRGTSKKKTETRSKTKKDDNPVTYICRSCKYTNVQWFDFESHCKVMHNVVALFPCTIPDCYMFYISKNGLKGHCSRLHKNALTCPECKVMATSLENLQEHMTSHKDKKFKCQACKRGFGSKWDCNRHFAKCLDNPERNISCKQCSLGGNSVDIPGAEDGLVVHLRQVHNLRGEWLCEICHRLSQSEARLEKHLEKCKRGKKITKAQPSSTESEVTD